MDTIRALSQHGDQCITWDLAAVGAQDTDALAAIGEAERLFTDTRARGGKAFLVQPDALPARIERFDPTHEHIMLIPPVGGG